MVVIKGLNSPAAFNSHEFSGWDINVCLVGNLKIIVKADKAYKFTKVTKAIVNAKRGKLTAEAAETLTQWGCRFWEESVPGGPREFPSG